MNKRAHRGFTLIEFLISLVILGAIIGILVGVFAFSAKQSTLDSKIMQVKDSLRQMADAGKLAAMNKDCPHYNGLYVGWGIKSCFLLQPGLINYGYLSAEPAIPSGINSGNSAEDSYNTPALWYPMSRAPGGCNAGNAGVKTVNVQVNLVHVSHDFCRAYNNSVGLGNTIVPSCSDNPAACPDDDPSPVSAKIFPATSGQTFCGLSSSDIPIIIYQTALSDGKCPGVLPPY